MYYVLIKFSLEARFSFSVVLIRFVTLVFCEFIEYLKTCFSLKTNNPFFVFENLPGLIGFPSITETGLVVFPALNKPLFPASQIPPSKSTKTHAGFIGTVDLHLQITTDSIENE